MGSSVFTTTMRRPIALILTLVAWLMATGSHWDLVQTFGWGRMIATYSQTMPLSQAVRLTFTADNFCGVCELVNDARGTAPADADAGAPSDLKKIQLACLAVPEVVVAALSAPRFAPHDERVPTPRAHPPLLRPPRIHAA